VKGAALVLLCACGRIGFEAANSDAGDGGPTLPCNVAGRVSDTFDDGVIDEFLWGARYQDSGTSTSEANGRVTFNLAPSSPTPAYAGIKSARFYDMRGQRFSTEIVHVAAAGTNSGMQIEYATTTYASVLVIDGSLLAAFETPTTPFKTVEVIPYVASEHRFWAISEDAGIVHYETSRDGITFTSFASTPAPFDVSLVRLTVFGGTSSSVAMPGSFEIESVGPATPVASTACPAHTLVDTFDDGVIGHLWERSFVNACCTLDETGGEIVVTHDGTVGIASLRSSAGFDLRADAVTVRISREPARPGTSLNLSLRFDDSNLLDLSVTPVMTFARRVVDGVSDTMSAPRDANERYLRIRETGGMYVMDVSKDRTTWRTLRSEAAPFPLDDLMLAIRAGIDTAGAAGPVASFDDVNAP
jgi:hypothetical protein